MKLLVPPRAVMPSTTIHGTSPGIGQINANYGYFGSGVGWDLVKIELDDVNEMTLGALYPVFTIEHYDLINAMLISLDEQPGVVFRYFGSIVYDHVYLRQVVPVLQEQSEEAPKKRVRMPTF